MASRLSPQDQNLLSVVGEVLHYIWDPIGVSGVPQTRDEYDGYVGSVFTLLRSGAEASEISAHLQQIASVRMDLPDCQEESDTAASVLTAWRHFLSEVGV